MHKLRLFTVFYKSTLLLSGLFSMAVAGLGGKLGFITAFGIAFMTGGWVLSLYYKEVTHKNEYVYYQNMGIAKSTLVISCILVNIIIGAICIIYDHAWCFRGRQHTKRYSERIILSDIYLKCTTGDILGIFGRNGTVLVNQPCWKLYSVWKTQTINSSE